MVLPSFRIVKQLKIAMDQSAYVPTNHQQFTVLKEENVKKYNELK